MWQVGSSYISGIRSSNEARHPPNKVINTFCCSICTRILKLCAALLLFFATFVNMSIGVTDVFCYESLLYFLCINDDGLKIFDILRFDHIICMVTS